MKKQASYNIKRPLYVQGIISIIYSSELCVAGKPFFFVTIHKRRKSHFQS